MRQIGERWNEQGFHVDFGNLYFSGEHNNAGSCRERGGASWGDNLRSVRQHSIPSRQSTSAAGHRQSSTSPPLALIAPPSTQMF
jgi:hypothetical protein